MKFPSGRKLPKKYLLNIDKFNGGSNSLLDEARMGKQFAVDATNLIQDQDGVWKTRWGTKFYGPEYALNPDGASEYVKSDATTELIVIANGKAWKSTDGGSITEVTGATFTAGLQCYFMQIAGFLYIANGTDPLARYNGTVLTKYTALSTPSGLSASRVASGLTSGVYTYYAEVTALNDVGETVGSTEASITVNKLRDNWTSTTDKITWSWNAVSGVSQYQLYLSDESGKESLLAGTTATNFTDDGSLAINPYVIPSLTDTTAAPKFKSMVVSGNRIWATNDANDLYKVYFSGTGQFLGNFSDFYGGGWINLEKGGRELPISVKHYQTGQGEGSPTVLCNTPDGRGAVWQLSISTATVGTTSFSVPSAIKVVGSFGTESILGVVNTGNDIAFPNRKGWFSLGPQTGYFGLLRTNERSSIIRPYWRNLISNKVSGICSYFYDAKIFISVPTSNAGNDRTIIFDTERSNWAVDWTIGAKQFLEYTDTSGNTHFLYIPTSGTQLVELSVNYLNDLGGVFNQSYLSPLIPISEDKTDVFSLQESIVELGRPRGSINFQILGVGKDGSFSTVASTTITSFGSNTGVGTDLAGECYASETQASVKQVGGVWTIYLLDAPSVFTQSTTRRGIRKKARLYAVQFKVSSTTTDTSFSILSIQARGTVISRKMPSQWLT